MLEPGHRKGSQDGEIEKGHNRVNEKVTKVGTTRGLCLFKVNSNCGCARSVKKKVKPKYF